MNRQSPNQEKANRIAEAVRTELTDALNTQKYQKLESYHRVEEAKKKAIACSRKRSKPKPANSSTLEGTDFPRRNAEGAAASRRPEVR